MVGVQGIVLNEELGLLVCVLHHSGIRPNEAAIKRHLRRNPHVCKGSLLTKTASMLLGLKPRSFEDLMSRHPPVRSQPVPPVQHIEISSGWSCTQCEGHFLTISKELMDRHVSSEHQMPPKRHSSGQPLWMECKLQTLFAMTGDRRYFRVFDDASESRSAIRCTVEDESAEDSFIQHLSEQRREHESSSGQAGRVKSYEAGARGAELWMRKLSLDQYVLGLPKDKMVESYKPAKDDEAALVDLREVVRLLLHETAEWCKPGSKQRLTGPQAARISSFWAGADPDRKDKVFRRLLRKESLKRYIQHWEHMITYCWRRWKGEILVESLATAYAGSETADSDSEAGETGAVDDGANVEQPAGEYLYMTTTQKACFQSFSDRVDAVKHMYEDDAEQKMELLQDSVLAIIESLIRQHLPCSPFQSPVLGYTAMLAVNIKYRSWEEPGSFNHHLSALIYCSQLCVFRIACKNVDRQRQGQGDLDGADDGLDAELDRLMKAYFTNTVSKPVGYLLTWRRILFALAPITMVNRPATWDLAKETVTYRGVSISMGDVRRLCRHTIDEAERLLFKELIFDRQDLTELRPQDLAENDGERSFGWWFGRHGQNSTLLHGHETVLAKHVTKTAELRRVYLEEDGEGQLSWRRGSIRMYRQLVQDFLERMAVAIHISAGPPVRAPEFMTPMWQNTEQLRHVQLRYGKILMHLTEHKAMSLTGKNVNNIRFLCDVLGKFLVVYLVYVVPLLEAMLWQEDVKAKVSPFLWVNADGVGWSEDRFGTLLQSACRRARVPEIGTAVWRQMSSAIINTHFDVSDRGCLLASQGHDEADDEVEEDGAGAAAATLVSMSNHSVRTHRNAYANCSPFANVWDGLLVKSHRASEAWATFFGLDRTVAGVKRRRSDVDEEHMAARKILSLGTARPRYQWTGMALLKEVRKLYKDESLSWKCNEQEQALRLIANRTPEVILVLATGSGKSLSFMLSSSLPGARTTVVVVPLVLLRMDLLRRCRELGLAPSVWGGGETPGLDSSPTLLFVSVEAAAQHGFRQYARRLYDMNNLDRIMIDECHLVHTSAYYRKSMGRLEELRHFSVPFVYMTATLPPRLESKLREQHHIGEASVVRGCTARPNICYGVLCLEVQEGKTFVETACKEILERWEGGMEVGWKKPRVMVFVKSREDAEEVASLLGCTFYHREICSAEEKGERLSEWMGSDSGSPFLACTTAAGAGVDYAHVRWVVHIQEPYGLINFVQESGRAGRDGEVAGSTIMVAKRGGMAARATGLDHDDPVDDQAMKQYIRGLECRRLTLGREMDEEKHWRACEEGDAECDVCDGSWAIERPSAGMMDSQDGEKGGMDGKKEMEGEKDIEEMKGGVVRRRERLMQEQMALDEYRSNLEMVKGQCMLCRILTVEGNWEHDLDGCRRAHKWGYIRCKQEVVKQAPKGAWMKGFRACFMCGQPQEICGKWEKEKEKRGRCEYRDLVMPTVWGLWEEGRREREWVGERLEVQVSSGAEALMAAGRASRFGGVDCVVGVKILASVLRRWSGMEE